MDHIPPSKAKMRGKTLKHSPNSPLSHHSRSPSSSPLRTPTTLTESIMQETIESAEKIIPRWSYPENSDHYTTALLFSADGSRDDAIEFISAVNTLQSAVSLLASGNSSSKLLVRSNELVQMAMKRLEREFSFILKSNASSVSDLASGSDDDAVLKMGSLTVVDRQRTLTDQAMNYLKSIADCMINCGYSKECAKIYRSARKSIVDGALYRLGVDRLSLNLHHKLDWEAVEEKIKNWLIAVKIATKSIFSEERVLCDFVLVSSSTICESCFSEVARDSAVSLFIFPEQVASNCKNSPEKLFRLLDLYEAISEVSLEILQIFSFNSSSAVRSKVNASLEKLRETVQATLVEFESAIKKDSSKNLITGGGVHPLTRYVMNYLSFLADYSSALEEILATWQLNLHAPLPEEYFVVQSSGEKKSNVAVQFAWIILVLLSKLDGKAEIYKEVSLSYIFLANNLQYIVGKVNKSELRRVVGDDWVAKHEEKVRQYAASYERVAWSKVIAPLQDGSPNRTAEVSLEQAKERFKKFNGAFLEVQKKHTEWVVADHSLRKEIKDSLARNVVSKYREMYARYRDKLAWEYGCVNCVVRYAPEDLENYTWGLLFGCSDGDSSSRSRCRASTTSFSTSSPPSASVKSLP